MNNIITNKSDQSPNYIVIALWVIAFFVYFYFNINIHMHESYVYSGSLEGFFDISEGHLQSSPWLKSYGQYGIYHPNHPLLHLMAFVLKTFLGIFNISLSALSAVSLFNTIFGCLGGLIFCRLLLLFTKDKIFATQMSLVLMFSDMYWFLSKSGEAYVAGQCFNLLSVYLIFKYINNQKIKYVIFQAICLGISMSFHSLFVFMILPQIYIFYKLHYGIYNKAFMKNAAIIFTIILFFGMSFYILPLYFHIGAKTFGEMVKVFLMYGDEMGVWTKSFDGLWDYLIQNVVVPFFSGILHFTYGVIDGVGSLSLFLRSLFILSFLIVFWKGFKNKRTENQFFIIWFTLYFVFTCYILFLPYDMTYWIFILPPFIFIASLVLLDTKGHKYIPAVILIILLSNNLYSDILPKHLVKAGRYFKTDMIHEEIKGVDQLGIVIFDSYAETSYLNYYGIIWNIKNNPLFNNVNIEIIIDNNNLSQKIDKLVLRNKNFYILRNNTDDKNSLNELESKLSDVKYFKTKSIKLTYKYNPKLDKTSEFQHEVVWYDLGPIGKSWNMDLDLYEKSLTK